MTDNLAERYYLDFAAAFVRGKLASAPDLPPAELVAFGKQAGLDFDKFKRKALLPRVRRVFGLLRSLAPTDLLDVGSGRGAFLWPLLDEFPELRVRAIDVLPHRIADLQAVAAGGIERLQVVAEDVTQLDLPDDAFDGVALLEVLEHLERPQLAVAQAVRVARRFVVVSVPSKPDDNPEHIHLFNGGSLTALFRGAGTQRVSIDFVLNHIVALALV